MIGTKYTFTNRNGDTVSFNETAAQAGLGTGYPDNYIGLQEYPSFDADIDNQELNKEGQHGVWDFPSFYRKRLLTFSGVIVATSEANANTLKEQLIKVFALPSVPTSTDDGYVVMTYTDLAGRAIQIEAKIQTPLRVSRPLKHTFRLDFNLILKAADPFFVGQNLQTASGDRGWFTGTLKLTTKLPLKLTTAYKQSFTATNNGNAPAETTIRMYGGTVQPITNPRIDNLTTGKFMQIDITLADDTEYVEIDSKTGAITDQDGNDVSPYIHAGSSFIQLEPGVNTLFYTSDENLDPTQSPLWLRVAPLEDVSVSFRDTIL